ncbi:MAG: hypothetical protein AB7V27_01215 [Candidatus Binatia bacterium]
MREEALAHQVADFDGELLARVALGVRDLRAMVAQCEAAEATWRASSMTCVAA